MPCSMSPFSLTYILCIKICIIITCQAVQLMSRSMLVKSHKSVNICFILHHIFDVLLRQTYVNFVCIAISVCMRTCTQKQSCKKMKNWLRNETNICGSHNEGLVVGSVAVQSQKGSRAKHSLPRRFRGYCGSPQIVLRCPLG